MQVGTHGPAAARRRRSEGGASLVEFALIAPLLFALLLGMFTGGMALSRKNSMTNSAREGARLGATSQKSDTWATTVRDRVRDGAGGDLTNAQICVQLVNSSNTVASGAGSQLLGSECSGISAPALPAGVAGTTQCVVKVWVHRTTDFNALFFHRTVNLDASSVARFERGSGTECNPS